MVPVIDQPKPLIWALVSVYLAVTAVFFAAMLGDNTERRLDAAHARLLMAAADRLAGRHRRLFPRVRGSDLFLLYDRARGTFNDPNVLGAFLVLPALLAFPTRAHRPRLG